MTTSSDPRLTIATKTMDALREREQVNRVFLRGSLTGNGPIDAYSDIDIGVDVSGHDNGAFAQEIVRIMEASFDVLFHDWPLSLLPDEYVCTFYLRDLSVFWNVDIECTADPHCPSLTADHVGNDPATHALHSWALDAKHFLRGHPNAERDIRRHASRVLGAESGEQWPTKLLMERVLERVCADCEERFPDLIQECRDVQARLAVK